MKTPREELLQALRELSELFPEWRFGQLVANVATAARGPQVESIWDSEDEELLAAGRRLVERNRERAPSTRWSSDCSVSSTWIRFLPRLWMIIRGAISVNS